MRPVVALVGILVAALPAAAQARPAVRVELNGARPPEALVRIEHLLDEQAFIDAMQSGFPLYLEYRLVLRQARALWDRTVDEVTWEYVVLYDPVRERYAVETPSGTQILPNRSALAGRLATVYLVGVQPDRPGRYHYQVHVNARTLSDEDVNEAFAWLHGTNGDSARVQQPGFLTRMARRVLMEVAPLPSLGLTERTPDFSWR